MIWLRREDDDRWAITTRCLRLPFTWNEDRWRHLFVIGSGGGRRSFADSLEQPPNLQDSFQIVSPVFQDIEFQREANGSITALLVGQHGPHHFSASFRVTAWENPGMYITTVEVDVADRCKAPISALCSSYQVHGPNTVLLGEDHSAIRWTAEPDDYGVELTVDNRTPDSSDPRPSLNLGEKGRAGVLAQIVAPIVGNHLTHRWSYLWTFAQTSPSFPSVEAS